MGLFKKNYVDRIKKLCERLDKAVIRDDDVLIKFNSKVKEIEEIDVEFIGLLNQIVRDGHISEVLKTALLNQLNFLLRRLESLKFEDRDKIPALKSAIEDVLRAELNVERLGVVCHGLIYHGSGISGIESFSVERDEFDYMRSNTLGEGIYCTDDKSAAIKYAVNRYDKYSNDERVAPYGARIRPTVYTFRLREGRNFIADMNDSVKIRAIYDELLKYLFRLQEKSPNSKPLQLIIYSLEAIIANKSMFRNFRLFTNEHKFFLMQITGFLQELGYQGLRCVEGGEVGGRFKWSGQMSYVIFNPADLELVSEEHFEIVNGAVVKVK